MKGLLTYVDEADHQAIRKAADSAGLSLRKWLRLVAVDAANRANGDGKDSLLGMLRQVRDHVCGNGAAIDSDAVAALVKLGLPQNQAEARVKRALAEHPGLSIEDTIKEALRQ